MSKQDFEFYDLGEGLPEFVVPKPQNDFYHGVFVPSASALALNGLHETVRTSIPEIDFHVGYVEGDINTYFKWLLPKDKGPLVQSRGLVFVQPREEIFSDADSAQDMVRDWVSNLYSNLQKPKPLVSKEDLADIFNEEQAATLEARLTPRRGNISEYEYITNHNDEPCDPHIKYCDLLPVRAYTWSPGPERKQSETTLPAVYNPTQFDILLASSVEVIIVNPLKSGQSTVQATTS